MKVRIHFKFQIQVRMDLNKGCFLLSKFTLLLYILDIMMSNYFHMTTYHKWKERLRKFTSFGKETNGLF